MATAKSLVVQSIRSPPDVKIASKPIPVAGLRTAVIEFSRTAMADEPTHIKSGLRVLRRRGRVAFMGGLGRDVSVPYFDVVLNSLEIKGRWMYTRSELRALVKLVETGILKIGKSAGHEVCGRFKLEEWEAALDAAARNASWGKAVVFTP